MSWWQWAQLWLVMKNVDGMVPLTFVFDEDGKKGLFGPAPSSSIASGAILGFSIRLAARHRASRPLRRATAAIVPAARTTTATRNARRSRALSSLHSVRHQAMAR